MPTYSYRCTECSNSFDIQQAFTDDSLTVCPSCSGKLRKLFSAVGVTFNGSGFYRTDSRAAETSKKSAPAAAAPAASTSGSSSGSGSSSASSASGSSSASTSKPSASSSTPASG